MPLLVWVGSGPSVGAGLPSWKELRQILTEALQDKTIGLDPRDADALRSKVDAIQNQKNNWVAFKMLRESLGATTYREVIRGAYAEVVKVKMPPTYLDIWRLGARGVLSLNLDRLVTRAHAESRPTVNLAEFAGHDIARLRPLLNGHQPFVGNLHGVFEDSRSWVWTKTDLDALLQDKAYRSFIETCLSTFTILFVGISADDRAVGGHLQHLASLDVETAAHYWLTDRNDFSTDQWAESAGIRLIRYSSSAGRKEIDEFFKDVAAYVPEDSEDVFAPVVPEGRLADIGEKKLPPLDELLGWDAESIRESLNAKAISILNTESDDDYESFSAEFDQAIYRAWYTSTNEGSNLLLGYTLNREISSGSFGRVYSATDPDGKTVAVKVLHEEVRRDPKLLKSFRRGVRSMRILHKHGVNGMVAYLDASEIPAFVVMELIDGPNLSEATQAGYLKEWVDLLKASTELAHTVRRAHELPERVLHRDLRPSNVMLSDYFYDQDAWSVVVLDFDLSWHRGAYEQSVLHTSAAGYLAPEQMRSIKSVSTRSAAVDSFGVGMTLLYLCSGKDPSPDQHLHKDWEDDVRRACDRMEGDIWRSVPERFARLIVAATRDNQAERWDMAEITGELDRLLGAVRDPDSVKSAELLTEEVAARCEALSGYEWDADGVRARRILPTGIRISLATELATQSVRLEIDWTRTGMEERGNLGKYIVAGAQATADQLRSFGWVQVKDEVKLGTVHIGASLSSEAVRSRLNDVADSIDKATSKLRSLRGR